MLLLVDTGDDDLLASVSVNTKLVVSLDDLACCLCFHMDMFRWWLTLVSVVVHTCFSCGSHMFQ